MLPRRARRVAARPRTCSACCSLVFWSLILVVVVKYLGFVCAPTTRARAASSRCWRSSQRRARRAQRARLRSRSWSRSFGAALLYGDGMITPAISVLSAVEGLDVASPALRPVVVPIALRDPGRAVPRPAPRHRADRRRSSAGDRWCWFVAIARRGLPWIVREPQHPRAPSNPMHAVHASSPRHGWHGFLVLGSVVLCVTGGEALYADMGHFGTRADPLAWYAVRLPGAAAQLLRPGRATCCDARRGASRTRSSAWCRLGVAVPMVVLATLATVIASQALISGAFSLTRQAMQLGYLPRVHDRPHLGRPEGQIYIPEVNWLLMVACVALVLAFRASSGPRRRVRHRRDRHDGDHLDPVLSCRAPALGLVAGRAGALLARLPRRRPRVPRRERAEDPARRLVPAAGRRRAVHGDDDLEARADAAGATLARRDAAGRPRSSPTSREKPAAACRARRCSCRRHPDGIPPCCCTTSSTTRCCTSRSCCSRS